MPYITRKQLEKLKKIAKTATMATSSFGDGAQEKFKAPLHHFGLTVETNPDEFIKKRTEVWRQAWIIDPLEIIIEDIEERERKRR